jgi:hypothetical protein
MKTRRLQLPGHVPSMGQRRDKHIIFVRETTWQTENLKAKKKMGR